MQTLKNTRYIISYVVRHSKSRQCLDHGHRALGECGLDKARAEFAKECAHHSSKKFVEVRLETINGGGAMKSEQVILSANVGSAA